MCHPQTITAIRATCGSSRPTTSCWRTRPLWMPRGKSRLRADLHKLELAFANLTGRLAVVSIVVSVVVSIVAAVIVKLITK
jgi:hypothetical protein